MRHPTFDTPSRWSVRAALAVGLGLAVMLRVWAIDWGAPYVYHPDEHLVLHPALDIVRDGDLNPHWFQYPSLLIYLQAGIVAAAQPFVRAPLTGRRLHLAFVIVPVVYFAVISPYPSRAERNLIILLPFLCLMGAAVCWRSAQLWRQHNAATAVFIIGALLMASPGVSASISWDRQRTLPDTRALALQWIDSHLPAGSRIAREQYTPQVPDGRLHVTYVWSLAWRDYAWYLDQGTDYLVVSSNVYNRALRPPYVGGVAGPRFYRFIFDHLPLMAEFVPGNGTSGPTVRIYQMPHG